MSRGKNAPFPRNGKPERQNKRRAEKYAGAAFLLVRILFMYP